MSGVTLPIRVGFESLRAPRAGREEAGLAGRGGAQLTWAQVLQRDHWRR